MTVDAAKAEQLRELELQIATLERQVKLEQEAGKSLITFTELTMRDYTSQNPLATRFHAAMHNKAIAQALEQVESGQILRLIVTLPPRHGKSELVSRRFPAWFQGKDKMRQFIFATYADAFADDFGREVREIITSEDYKIIFPNVEPMADTRSASRLKIKDGGLMVFTGVGGAITGRGADLLLIDDPFKNREEAESIVIRNKRWDWFTSTAYTRLMPGGRIVVVCTRWHEDDIVGRIMNTDYIPEEESKLWTIIDLPAIANENTPNEKALWPDRYPLEVLRSIRSVVGARDWNSLYQQKPTPPEGIFFKRDDILKCLYSTKELPNNLTKYSAFDLAVSKEKEKRRDHTCCGTGGLDETDTLWILPDIYWEKRAADQSVEYIAEHIRVHDPIVIYCEKGQLDKAVGPFLEKYLNEQKIYKYFEKMPSVTNKGARATAIRGRIAQGKVKFPRDASWWPAAFDQLLKFTDTGDSKEDDFVDFISLLGQGLNRQVYNNVIPLESRQHSGKVGTLAWVREESDRKKREDKLAKSVQGW